MKELLLLLAPVILGVGVLITLFLVGWAWVRLCRMNAEFEVLAREVRDRARAERLPPVVPRSCGGEDACHGARSVFDTASGVVVFRAPRRDSEDLMLRDFSAQVYPFVDGEGGSR